MSASQLTEHFFRHEYGRLVAVLARRVGPRRLDDIEDAVQNALMIAIQTWPASGLPERPSAWLYRVACNCLLGELRKNSNRRVILERDLFPAVNSSGEEPDFVSDDEVKDDLLRMLFVCCDEALPIGSQLAFALKTLCGFDVREIAIRLFTTEANVYKRLERARQRLRRQPLRLGTLTNQDHASRLPTVRQVLYLLFTEGYLSCHAELAIRRELCDEAIRLGSILAEHPASADPETFALLALMQLHRARLASRQDASGGLLLLEEQDRGDWDRDRIFLGLSWLTKASAGDRFSRFHAEAGIAAAHCLAPSYTETPWERIVECYELLEQLAPSALHRLNRAVAVAEWKGAAAGLSLLNGYEPPAWLAGSYMWAAVLADLHRRNRDLETAKTYRASALQLSPSIQIRDLLRRRLTASERPRDHRASSAG